MKFILKGCDKTLGEKPLTQIKQGELEKKGIDLTEITKILTAKMTVPKTTGE